MLCEGFEQTIIACDVCVLVDGDERQKACIYCPKCDAWICEWCRPKTFRRMYAMLKRRIQIALA